MALFTEPIGVHARGSSSGLVLTTAPLVTEPDALFFLLGILVKLFVLVLTAVLLLRLLVLVLAAVERTDLVMCELLLLLLSVFECSSSSTVLPRRPV